MRNTVAKRLREIARKRFEHVKGETSRLMKNATTGQLKWQGYRRVVRDLKALWKRRHELAS